MLKRQISKEMTVKGHYQNRAPEQKNRQSKTVQNLNFCVNDRESLAFYGVNGAVVDGDLPYKK